MMIDGIPNRPLYFYQKDITAGDFYEISRDLIDIYRGILISIIYHV